MSPTRTCRQFAATYKLQILAAADACTRLGDLGALLCLEDLYSSHLAVSNATRRRGDLQGAAKRRGPPRSAPNLARKQITELEHALVKTTARAERADFIISVRDAARSRHVPLRRVHYVSALGCARRDPRATATWSYQTFVEGAKVKRLNERGSPCQRSPREIVSVGSMSSSKRIGSSFRPR